MNVIADNMYAQIDNEGNMFQLLDEIMDHKKDDMAIDIANGTVTLKSWVKLKDLKASNPVELAEYAVANWIAEEPAFKW